MHTLLRGKKTPDHKSPDHKRIKKDKRNNKKLLTNRKQCYIIQSSTRDKRNKKRETQLQNKKNGGSKNEKVVKCRIKQRGK